MTNEDAEPVLARYHAGFAVLSYLVSLIGCVTTLELLHRRTSRHGAYNWYSQPPHALDEMFSNSRCRYLLVTSSITMGGIGIWCMHFVGNRAIIMAEGQPALQIIYNTGFTSISFFLPIIVLSGAFYLLAATGRINRYSIAFAGVLMGVAIGGMHYLGQLGISNYRCNYRAANVAGAAIISIVASVIALSVFFKLRESWTDSWWKRMVCGIILACSVSGMHWTATVGTWYRFKGFGSMPTDPLSREQIVIICSTLVRHLFQHLRDLSNQLPVMCNLSSSASGCSACRLQEEKMQKPSSTTSSRLWVLR
jgi:NO-binding membrane sensor protein with MHYT domain